MITEFAPAKINLTLHVKGCRPDGYHLIESLVAFADVGDVVSVVPGPQEGISLHVTGENAAALGDMQRNLVYRAAQAVKAAFGIKEGVAITLDKRLPVASGIGGGSADAAATLRALRKLWVLPEDGRWQDIAATLGADVPVCLDSKTARISGVGEKVTSAVIPPCCVLLVNPGQPLMTRDVFTAYASTDAKPAATHAIDWLQETSNDLERPAISLLPVIGDVLHIVSRQEGCGLARMSGSGATCFGLFEGEDAMQKAAAVIQALQPHWWVRAAHIPYEVQHGR